MRYRPGLVLERDDATRNRILSDDAPVERFHAIPHADRPDSRRSAGWWEGGAPRRVLSSDTQIYVSGRWGPQFAYLDGAKFHGSRSSKRLCGRQLAMAVRVALRYANSNNLS